MSLILEALRRSEAQRQLGRTPDVLTPMPVLRAQHNAANRRWWIALVAVALLVAGWMGWRSLHRSTAASVESRNVQTTSSVPSAEGVGTPMPATVPKPAAIGVGSSVSAIPAPMSDAPTSNSIIASGIAIDRQHDASIAILSPTTSVAKANIPTSPSNTPAIGAAQVNASALPPTVASLPKQPATSPLIPDVPAPAADVLLPVNDLPAGERAALPTLKVSMHVYAESPADRFMIIDGMRIGEGGRIGTHIVLVKIRNDGGVLDIDGHRVLLPRP